MLINSMQLIAHIPLLANKLPANAHYFLLNFLGFVRLNFEYVNAQMDTLKDSMKEAQLIANEDGTFNAHLHAAGYHFSFLHNMMLVLCIAAVIALVWFITAIL